MPAEAKWRLLDVGTGSGLGLAPGLALLSCGGQQQQPAVLTLIEPSVEMLGVGLGRIEPTFDPHSTVLNERPMHTEHLFHSNIRLALFRHI